jgi:hypothetical protein
MKKTEHKDITKLVVEKIIRRKPYYNLNRGQVMWIWRRYMHYLALSLAHGTQVKMSTRFQFVLKYRIPRYESTRKGIRTAISDRFAFHVFILGRFEKMKYHYRPTKWMHKKIKQAIDMDRKLEIIPQ